MGNGQNTAMVKLLKEITSEFQRTKEVPVKKINELFQLTDRDKSGFLENSEAVKLFNNLFDFLKKNNSIEQYEKKDTCVRRWLSEFDRNDDGKLSEVEFVECMCQLMSITSQQDMKIILLGARQTELVKMAETTVSQKYSPLSSPAAFRDFEKRSDNGMILTISSTIGPSSLNLDDSDEDHCRYRKLSFIATDLAFIVISVIIPWTAKLIPMYVEEINESVPGLPFFIVGVHTEAREEAIKEGKEVVTLEEGMELQKQYGSLAYCEVAVSQQKGLLELINEAKLEILKKKGET